MGSTRRDRRTPAAAHSSLASGLLVLAVFHGIGCGGEATGSSEAGAATELPSASGNAGPVLVPARAAAPEPVAPQAPGGIPAPVRALLDDTPRQLDEAQFSSLLDHYCVTCHATPACSAACDGFFFDDWDHLAAGGRAGPESIELMLTRVVDRLRDGSMPPALNGEIYDLPGAARDRMIEFIEDELDASLAAR